MPNDATLTAPDPGAVDASALSDSGADAADTSAVGVPGDAAAETTDAAVTAAATEAVDSTTTDASQPAPAIEIAAGAPLPQQFRNLAKHPDPEVAKLAPLVQSMYDRLQAYTTHFPSVADAKEFSAAFPGGVKDAIAAQARAAELDEVDNAYFSRDPEEHTSLARDWAQNDPEAFASLTEAAANVLAETNPRAYQGIGEKVLAGTLANLYRTALGIGNKDAADRIAQLHKDVFGHALGEQPHADPRDLQFRQREEALRRQEQDLQTRAASEFATSANTQVGRQLTAQITANLATALARLKVSDGAKGRIANEIYDDINAKLIEDRGLQMRLQSIAQAGRRSGFTEQHRQQWTDAVSARARALLPTSAKLIVDRWTQDYLGVVSSKNAKITSAASRKDVGGGGLPDHSLAPLTAEQIDKMSNAELFAYQGPIAPDARQKLREMRSRPAAARP